MAALPLTKPQLAVITAACSQHHVSRLYLFGSLLRPDYRPGQSDIDLLVEFQPLEPSELVDAYFGLEEQLPGSRGTPVALVMADAVRNPYVRRDIEASKQLIYEA
ncbi:MAG: nucleotidyltransferase family protein [Cyanobacteriota bacterium]